MKAKLPTKVQLARWDVLREHGCLICGNYPQIHHLFTGMGGRKNHDKVAPLCHTHHQGAEGIHRIGRKAFAARFMSEQEMYDKCVQLAPID
jgi:hypothetical protein